MKVRIGEYDVLSSTTIVSHTSAITLYPIAEDTEFGLLIRVTFNDRDPGRINIMDEGGPKTTVVQFDGQFRPGIEMATAQPIRYATTDDKLQDYCVNIFIQAIGAFEESLTYVFSCTFFKRNAK